MSAEGASLLRTHIETFKENFSLLDDDKDGLLNHQQVAILFRAFGQNPSDQALSEFLMGYPQLMSFEDFSRFFKNSYRTPLGEREMLNSMRIFDPQDQGRLSIATLRRVLGSELSSAEMEELLQLAKPDMKGFVDYVRLVKILCDGPQIDV